MVSIISSLGIIIFNLDTRQAKFCSTFGRTFTVTSVLVRDSWLV